MTLARKEMPRFNLDPDAKFGTRLRDHVSFQEPAKEPGRVWTFLAYAGLVMGAGLTVFLLTTPVKANGSLGIDVRVISPSITSYGPAPSTRKLREFRAQEAVKTQHKMILEQQRSDNARALEADKAYYKKLADQRKANKGK